MTRLPSIKELRAAEAEAEVKIYTRRAEAIKSMVEMKKIPVAQRTPQDRAIIALLRNQLQED